MNYAHEVTAFNMKTAAESEIWDLSEHMKVRHNMVQILWNNGIPVAQFWWQGVQIGWTRNIFTLSDTQMPPLDQRRENCLSDVLSVLDSNEISLNHVGFSIHVPNASIDTEVARIVDIIKNSTHKIYEDPAGKKENMRWLFIWDATSDAPMCEIVLPKKCVGMKPHVQFDIDTKLSFDEIHKNISQYYGDNFLDWHLDIENVGRVLSMGTYQNKWIDLRIGIGNNLRSREDHRKSMIEL